MSTPMRFPVFLALATVLSHPASACEPAAAAGAGGVDPMPTSCVALDTAMAGDIAITGAWARAMLPGQPAGSGFVTLENKGTAADRLVSVASAAAGRVELHSMDVVDDVMVMRPVETGIPIAPGETVALEPGRMHLMFLDVGQRFAEGDTVQVTLTFEKAGAVEVELPVMRAAAKEAAPAGHHTH
jgi:copper(I)-binding protein